MERKRRVRIILMLFLCGEIALSATVPTAEFGTDISQHVQQRISDLLSHTSTAEPVLLAFGSSPSARALIPDYEVMKLPAEGFVVRSGVVSDVRTIASRGAGGGPAGGTPQLQKCNRGVLFGAYELLERVGLRFLHPLQPAIPTQLVLPSAAINTTQSPHWPIRTWELHTQHPIELAEVLNGWSQDGYLNASGWADMLPDLDKFVEWLIANKQNRFQYNLLMSYEWMDFAMSTTRQDRLRNVTSLAHQWCMGVGADVPIAFVQQHSWTLVRSFGASVPLSTQLQEIRTHIDWYAACGFDFLPTESGSSEFTHPSDLLMLAWINETASYARQKHNLHSYIKCHCSTGQKCTHFNNSAGKPLNFNFLPSKAVLDMGVMPHTVQFYALDDYAPVYGNTNFTYMSKFMYEEAVTPRETLFYPETEYWVSFDSPVPLFLPLYASRRLHDLRSIGKHQLQSGVSIDGQLNFDSGWEWSYWLGSVVTARAVWNPRLDLSDGDALVNALSPLTSPFDKDTAQELQDILISAMKAQYDTFIQGLPYNASSSGSTEQAARAAAGAVNLTYRTGIAYLEGYDSFADISTIIKHGLVVAPTRLPLRSLLTSSDARDFYAANVRALLQNMAKTFSALSARLQAISQAPAHMMPLLLDLQDSMAITSLRATQVYQLYEYAYSQRKDTAALAQAQSVRRTARAVTVRREAHYRVNLNRIAGWRNNPTCYAYTYLWTVHSGYFMYRDELEVTTDGFFSPCTMNVQNFLREFVDFKGEPVILQLLQDVRNKLHNSSWHVLTDCLAPPEDEPTYPA